MDTNKICGSTHVPTRTTALGHAGKAREASYIPQFATLKTLPVTHNEHGLNMPLVQYLGLVEMV